MKKNNSGVDLAHISRWEEFQNKGLRKMTKNHMSSLSSGPIDLNEKSLLTIGEQQHCALGCLEVSRDQRRSFVHMWQCCNQSLPLSPSARRRRR